MILYEKYQKVILILLVVVFFSSCHRKIIKYSPQQAKIIEKNEHEIYSKILQTFDNIVGVSEYTFTIPETEFGEDDLKYNWVNNYIIKDFLKK